MGGASSKSARQFPKHTKPTWAGARTPSLQAHAEPKSNTPRASEARTAAIEKDSKDPHLAANLNRLGPVRVDHHMQSIRPMVDQVSHTFQSRLQSEQQAHSSQSTRNRLVASALMELLEERKSISRPADLQGLADRYNLDVSKMESIARYMSSPSVAPSSVVRVVNEDGSERTTMRATWVDPSTQTA